MEIQDANECRGPTVRQSSYVQSQSASGLVLQSTFANSSGKLRVQSEALDGLDKRPDVSSDSVRSQSSDRLGGLHLRAHVVVDMPFESF